ncbi:Uncharacterised protein [[Clostridium] sordellii]|uniref:hypothetical protein n=1 Tax=Paraclostridium sordellii TaxID=1505 RepID=UPI0005E0FC46|nr:hypothetical protein [Paeniclostridium sordellii]CEQ01628.1 Uncharacterised protein [[Clostridium] sordellii] [Paeniclostridium sordellii]
MENDRIKCPYCASKRLQIIGASIRETYRSYVSETKYKCLDNGEHIFTLCKYNRMNDK